MRNNALVFVFLFIGVCHCKFEFYERPRNFSVEILYFTQLETDGHLVISPYGIWSLLATLSNIVTDRSKSQILRAGFLSKEQSLILGYKDLNNKLTLSSKDVNLVTKNFVFADTDFISNIALRYSLLSNFDVSLKVLDFDDDNTARIANLYIEKGGGRLSNVFNKDDFREARMIFVNTVYFRGLWASPFNNSDTTREPFYNEDKEVIGYVNMMFQRRRLPYAEMDSIKSFVLKLSYGSSSYCMLILLPYPSVKIKDMYKTLGVVSLKEVFKKLKDDTDTVGAEEIEVKLPRFRISSNIALDKPLNSMGVYDLFNPDYANLRNITSGGIYVSSIVHKADIEVTESGTDATMSVDSLIVERVTVPSFYANKPFLYFIMEESTATVIFSGIYSKPTLY